MDKNIKKIISEAFNELYEEMVNEAPATLKKNTILDSEIESIIEKAKTTGRGVSYDDTANESSQNNFNIIIDNLISDYKNTESPTREMSKKAIQNAFAPIKGNKIYRLAGQKFITDPNLEDAASNSYESIFVNNFDSLVNKYKLDQGFSALAQSALANRIHNYIVQGHGGDFSAQDPLAGGRYSKTGAAKSMDDEYGDGGRFGDSFAGPEDKESGFAQSKREAQSKLQKKQWDSLKGWVESNKERMSEKTYIVVSEMLNGLPSDEIPNQYPNFNWKGGNNVPTIIFRNFAIGPLGQSVSEFISGLYDIDFDLSKINPNNLEQWSAQSPEHGNISYKTEKMSPEMKEIFNDLREFLKQIPGTNSIISNLKATSVIAQVPSENALNDFANKTFNKPFRMLSNEEKEIARNESGWGGFKKLFNNIDQESINTIKELVEQLKYEAEKSQESGMGGFRTDVTKLEIDPRETLNDFMNKKGVDPSEYDRWQINGIGALEKIADEHGFNEKEIELMKDYANEVQKYTYGGQFEGVKESDIEKLMERVLRRLSK